MNDDNFLASVFGVCSGLCIIFLTLATCHIIHWNLFWLFSPLLLPLVTLAIFNFAWMVVGSAVYLYATITHQKYNTDIWWWF